MPIADGGGLTTWTTTHPTMGGKPFVCFSSYYIRLAWEECEIIGNRTNAELTVKLRIKVVGNFSGIGLFQICESIRRQLLLSCGRANSAVVYDNNNNNPGGGRRCAAVG